MVKKYHLEELKIYYNQEYQRKDSLETKSSYMLAISSILLTIFIDILVNINNNPIFNSNLLLVLSSIFIFSSVISIVCCMINVSVVTFKFPMDICSIQNINQLDENDLYEELYENYIECIKSNFKKIDRKVCLLNIVYISNSIMLLLLLSLLGYVIIIMG